MPDHPGMHYSYPQSDQGCHGLPSSKHYILVPWEKLCFELHDPLIQVAITTIHGMIARSSNYLQYFAHSLLHIKR